MPRVGVQDYLQHYYETLDGTGTPLPEPSPLPTCKIASAPGEDPLGTSGLSLTVAWVGHGIARAPWSPAAEGTHYGVWGESSLGYGDAHPFEVYVDPASTMVASYPASPSFGSVLDSYISTIRTLLGDDGLYVTHNIPIGVINGVNKRFQAQYFPLAAGSLLYTSAGVLVSSGFTLNADTGMVVFDSAPALGASYFIEGTVHRYPSVRVVDSLQHAVQVLYGVWGGKYLATGSRATLAVSPAPSGADHTIIMLTAALILLQSQRAAAAASGIRYSSPAGSQDTTQRAQDIASLTLSLTHQLNQITDEVGYRAPRFLAVAYSGWYDGGVLADEGEAGVLQ